MKILHVIEVTDGGVVTYARALMNHQTSRGHSVIAVHPIGPTFENVESKTWGFTRRRPEQWRQWSRWLRRLTDAEQPDVIHLHSFFPGLIGRTNAQSARIIYQPHGWAINAVPAAAKRIVVLLEKILTRNTDVIVVNCDDERKELERHKIIARIESIGIPIDISHFRPTARTPEPNRNQILCIGRICKQKNQKALAAAWEKRPTDDLILTFVGPGSPREIKHAAPTSYGKTLHIQPAVKDVRPLLSKAACLLIPSLYEGQSVAMAEALACAVPVVSTAVNGAAEAITEGPHKPGGSVVPLGDIDGLLTAATRIAKDPIKRKTTAAGARDRAVAKFADSEVSARLESIYMSIQKGKDGRRRRE